VYDAGRGGVVSSIRDAYLDRASKWSDIQEYLPFLHEQAWSRPGCRVLELGARRCTSTLAFLAGVAEAGGHVWSCDVQDVRQLPGGIGMWARNPLWTFVQGDDMDDDVQAQLPPVCDLLFIDTSHEYEHTLAELRAYMPRVAPGGIALFHDTNVYDWPGYDWHGEVPPVRQALDEWCAEAGREWENLPGQYGLGVIRAG
jgi:cephalosporin hydroxylase